MRTAHRQLHGSSSALPGIGMACAALLVSLLLAATPALAAGSNGSSSCSYDGNQQEINACALSDYNAADKILNKQYKEIMLSLPSSKQAALRSQQRIWLKQRDQKCTAEAEETAGDEGATMWPQIFYGCLHKLTEQRTKELAVWSVK